MFMLAGSSGKTLLVDVKVVHNNLNNFGIEEDNK